MVLIDMDMPNKKNGAVLIIYPDGKCAFEDGKTYQAIPAADVVAVRHGRWSMTKDGAAYCSACKRKMNPYLYGYAHCAMCGAKMDGGANA